MSLIPELCARDLQRAAELLRTMARMKRSEESPCGSSAGDDAVETLDRLISEAREITGVYPLVVCRECGEEIGEQAKYANTPCGHFCIECMETIHAPGFAACGEDIDDVNDTPLSKLEADRQVGETEPRVEP